MAASDVFSRINSHMVEGMMLHNQMADYYDFLGLMGFKRLHEYRFLCEATQMRGVSRYYINHYNKLLPPTDVLEPEIVPAGWGKYTRMDVEPSTKRNAIRTCMDKWRKWEFDTKKLYQESYSDLCDIGEVAAACKVKELVADADMELKCADRLCIKLQSVDYDLCTIFLMQDEMPGQYKEKEDPIGVHIC